MTSTARQTVLIIDDDPFLRAFAVAVLENAGYLTEQAETAVKGVVAALRARPDLILLDYAMPVNDGLEVIEGLIGVEGMGSTPVIVLSAWKTDPVKAKIKVLGASWLDKPVSAEALVAAVRRRLSA